MKNSNEMVVYDYESDPEKGIGGVPIKHLPTGLAITVIGRNFMKEICDDEYRFKQKSKMIEKRKSEMIEKRK